MAKTKNEIFYCTECGTETPKWSGQCFNCKAWNTIVMAPKSSVKVKDDGMLKSYDKKPLTLDEISTAKEDRCSTGFTELDRVLGGGVVNASLCLVGGDPGIGKSTLLLQMCKNMSDNGIKVLYVSGEESLKQIKLRANRIGQFNDNMRLLCETDLSAIKNVILDEKPDIVIIDSIQTMYSDNVESSPGSISQVREATTSLMKFAKEECVTIFIVGHVTKEGTVAGPRMLEHMVDTVLYFEGDRNASYRIIRGVKNRFGATNEIGVFEMTEAGLKEVPNPSEYMISGRPQNSSGCVVSCFLEGTRPMLLEIQALICQSNFGMARRTAAGTDYNRVNLLMAVLEKHLGIMLGNCDAYINIAGGIKVNDPSIDLAIVAAIISSFRNKSISPRLIIFGEVGLSGEVRGVSQPQMRVNEAKKLGFEYCILPEVCLKAVKEDKGIKIIGVNGVKELVDKMFLFT